MRRSICTFAALLHQEKPSLSKMKLQNNFKEWKFKDPPNYAELPIDENPEYNIPVAVKNAVFSKVWQFSLLLILVVLNVNISSSSS